MTVSSNKSKNKVRIIGGEWRSRMLQFADVEDIRPTPDRIRETLFNWLQFKITGAHCLDLFAGSGILGFEALSRHATSVTACEQNEQAGKAIRANCETLQTGKLQLLKTDSMSWLQHHVSRPFNIVFIDPPFAAGLHEQCFELLSARGWLAPGAQIYIEAASPISSFSFPDNWTLEKEKRAGTVHYGLCQY